MQDNAAQLTARAASIQPMPTEKGVCASASETVFVRSQMHANHGEKLERVVAYIPHEIKAELERITNQWQEKDKSISLSAVMAAFLKRQVQGHIDMQYGALLGPIMKQTVREEMRTLASKLVWLLVRIAHDTGQTRSLATNILNRQPGMTDEIFRDIVKESAKAPKRNLTRQSPQIHELIAVVERWMFEKAPAPTL